MNSSFLQKRKTLLSYRSIRQKKTAFHAVDGHLKLLFDDGVYKELEEDRVTRDPLQFPEYEQKLQSQRSHTGAKSGCTVGIGTVQGMPLVAAELSRYFLMGSMGSVEGDKLTLAFEEAGKRHLPLVIFSASGGARMQEGMFSLLQMAKTSAAAKRYKEQGGLYISVMLHPTTGGVSASYASLGDIVLAEPKALIGFAGPRVIEQTIGEKLPAGFQRAEFQLTHGFVDRIVAPENMREEIAHILRLHRCNQVNRASEEEMCQLKSSCLESDKPVDLSTETLAENTAEITTDESVNDILKKQKKKSAFADQLRGKRSAYERVMLARGKDRPKIRDFIDAIFDDFLELSGDRLGMDDQAIIGGIAMLGEQPVTVIGHRKEKTLRGNKECNFGMPQPQGYRKALRLMKEAEKFGRPIVTFVDTPGAYPGKDAEENGQSVAIAENLAEMSALKVPVIVIVTGEGNSGGALAIGVGDQMWMLENAVYSVLSPEGFASILWKDASRMKEACDVMKMTAADLYEDGLAEHVIAEPEEGLTTSNMQRTTRAIRRALSAELPPLLAMEPETLIQERYEKYRRVL